MVKTLHRAGIEVILDAVFNHTAEDGPDGPTQCFRGLDNPTYYLPGEDRSLYANFTGTGNTAQREPSSNTPHDYGLTVALPLGIDRPSCLCAITAQLRATC